MGQTAITYVKKPDTVQAKQWDGTIESAVDIVEWLSGSATIKLTALQRHLDVGASRVAHPGDWVVTQSSLLPSVMSDEEFTETYARQYSPGGIVASESGDLASLFARIPQARIIRYTGTDEGGQS